MSWNYRVCTNIDKTLPELPRRVFYILSVYYKDNTDDHPQGYQDLKHPGQICTDQDIEELRDEIVKFYTALSKPTIDLDNFPNLYNANGTVVVLPIGTQLRELRKSKPITGKDLAKMIGMSPVTISRIEQNKTDLNYETLIKILTAIGRTIYDLKM